MIEGWSCCRGASPGCEAALPPRVGARLHSCLTILPPKSNRESGGENKCDHADPQRDKNATYCDLDAQHKPQQMATCDYRQEERRNHRRRLHGSPPGSQVVGLSARVGRARSLAAHLFPHHRAHRSHTVAFRSLALPCARQLGVRPERPRVEPNQPYSVLNRSVSTGLSNFNVPDPIEQSFNCSTTIGWI